MPVGSTYDAASLDGLVGGWPTSGNWRLYSSDPSVEDTPSDVELGTDGGYAAVDYASSDWVDADTDTGTKATASNVSFGTSTGAYSDTATYWGITSTDADTLVYSDALTQPIPISASGQTAAFKPTLYLQDGG